MIYIYGEGKGEQTAKELSIPSYASLPIDPSIAALCDAGKIEEFDHPYLDANGEIPVIFKLIHTKGREHVYYQRICHA